MTTHPHPPDSNTVIWRYMDETKFADLLGTFSQHHLWRESHAQDVKYFNEPGQLWFSYPWAFEDTYEGTLPDINDNPDEYCDCMAAKRRLSSADAAALKRRFLAADTLTLRDCNVLLAQLCGVSCWHRNATVTSDMWSFAGMANGVAIRTTVGKLEHALCGAHNTPAKHAQPSVCAVGYVDYSSYFLEFDGFRSLLAIVEESWSNENEIRFVAKSPSFIKLPLRISPPLNRSEPLRGPTKEEIQQRMEAIRDQAREDFKSLRAANTRGFNLPIKLEGLIDEVVIKPGADATYATSVRDALCTRGLSSATVSTS